MTTIRKRPGSTSISSDNPKLVISAFTNCCGLNIQYGLERYTPGSYSQYKTKEKACEALREYLVWSKKNPHLQSAAAQLVALNGNQEEMFGPTMLAAGYSKIIDGAHNGLHDSLIYLYAVVNRPEFSNPTVLSSGDGLDY